MAEFDTRKALTKAVEDCPTKKIRNQTLAHCDIKSVEKFIRNHNLGIKLADVIAYTDIGILGSGKKGHMITENFLYINHSGKNGIAIDFTDMTDAMCNGGYVQVLRLTGHVDRYSVGDCAEDFAKLLSCIAEALGAEPAEAAEPQREVISEPAAAPETVQYVEEEPETAVLETCSTGKYTQQDIDLILETFRYMQEGDFGSLEEARKKYEAVSELVGAGFEEEYYLSFTDENDMEFEVKNTDLPLEYMYPIVADYLASVLGIEEITEEEHGLNLCYRYDFTEEKFRKTLAEAEEYFVVKEGLLSDLPYSRDYSVLEFIYIIVLLILPVEAGFEDLLIYIKTQEAALEDTAEAEEEISGYDVQEKYPYHLIDEDYDYEEEEDEFESFRVQRRMVYDAAVRKKAKAKHIEDMKRSVKDYLGREVDTSVLPAFVTNVIRDKITDPDEVWFWKNICAYSYNPEYHNGNSSAPDSYLVNDIIRDTKGAYAEKYIHGKTNPESHLDMQLQQKVADAIYLAVAVVGDKGVGKSTLLRALTEQYRSWGTVEDYRNTFDLDVTTLEMSAFDVDEQTFTGVEIRINKELTEENYLKLKEEIRLCNLKGYVLVVDMEKPVLDRQTEILTHIFKTMGIPCITVAANKRDLFEEEYPDVMISRNYYRKFLEENVAPLYGEQLGVHIVSAVTPDDECGYKHKVERIATDVFSEAWWKYKDEWWHPSCKDKF